jgi:uncharacterized protein (TIRG00374 family)
MVTKPKEAWKTIVFIVLGLAAFFAYIYVFNVDIWQIIETIKSVNLYIYLLAAIAVIFEIFFFTVAWHFLLRFLSVKLSIVKSFLFVLFGIFIDTLIPAESISAEISKIYLVNREQNGTAGQATASIVAQRIIGMTMHIITLLVGAILLLTEKQLFGIMLNLILLLIIATFFVLSLILLLCVKEKWTFRIIDAVIRFAEWVSRGRWKLIKIREEVIEAAKAFHSAMRQYRRAYKTLLAASSFSVISWVLSMSVIYLSFLSIGYTSISWSAILVICSIFAAAKSIPIGIPFDVGLPEITLYTLFIVVGVPPETSATATILIRIVTLWMTFFIGFAAQQWLGIKSITEASTNIKLGNVETEKA